MLEFQYTVNDRVKHPKKFCRDLGVCVDNRLSLRRHSLIIARNAYYKAKSFFRTFTCPDNDFPLLFYKTHIKSLV